MEADLALYHEVSQFLYREARLQDDHEWDAWEALWTDDGVYWIPANGDDIDPQEQMSILYDNRSRIALRIRQLHTGRRHAQEPRSRLRRTVSNIEIMEIDGEELQVASNAMIFESNLRGDTLWSARNEFRLRRVDGAWRMARKTVFLTNNDKALYTMAFLV
ncbi:MAG: dioxygenase [Caulobacter sp.]|jgi:3-phenylpropionate/cinnamic acid dioxygenase small subunit|nr:dioxygenase [Caulobacter sp.]